MALRTEAQIKKELKREYDFLNKLTKKAPPSSRATSASANIQQRKKEAQAKINSLSAELKALPKRGKAATTIAKQAAAASPKVPAKTSPTDVMRQVGRRREVLAGPKVKQSGADKPVAPKKPVASEKPSGSSFGQAFKEARAKFDAGTGNTTFKFNGSTYSVAKPAELKAAGGTYGKKLNDMLKSKQRSSETDKQVTNKRGSKKEGPRQKMINRLEREKAAKKSYGGGMTKKTARRKGGGNMAGKPKGVGCATRGYGKAMK